MALKDDRGSMILDSDIFPWNNINSKEKLLPCASGILSDVNCRSAKKLLSHFNPSFDSNMAGEA